MVVALTAVSGVVLGYFLGREHLKYQMRSALSDVAKAFSGPFNHSASAAGTLDSVDARNESIPRLMIGQTHRSSGFSVALTNATIAKPKARDFMGDLGEGKNENLIVTFRITNMDDRRILRFRGGNQFLGRHFGLRDDVDNVIRGIDFGFGHTIVGALTGDEDIAPGDTATHVEVFSVPPPKTQFLVLTVDLACLGDDGIIEFKIPVSSIINSR